MTPTPQVMWRSWLILGSLVLACAVLAFRGGGAERVGEAVTFSTKLFLSVLPNLLLGFALAGFLHVLLPSELIVTWMGERAGIKGLFIGTLAGTLTPGGPFTHFPILASFLAKGAGVGPVCAYIAAWALLGLNRFLVWELPILGPQIAFARLASAVWFPPLIGWCGAVVYRVLARS